MAQPIVSVHIHKTGGKTFRELLQQLPRTRVFFDYYDWPLSPDFQRRRLVSAPHQIYGLIRNGLIAWRDPRRQVIIHGHFLATKYDWLFPQAPLLTWFREPVEMVASHFYYRQRKPLAGDRRMKAQIEGRTLLEFAEVEVLRNVHRRYLNGKPLEQFDFVGITEDFDRSLTLFLRIFYPGLAKVEYEALHQNPARPGPRYELDPETRRTLARLNERDCELYQQAVERFQQLCRQYEVP